MSPIESRLEATPATAETPRGWARWAAPAMAALIITAVVLAVIVTASSSVFGLLGAGRGLISEDWYPLGGFLLILITTVGLVVAWVAGSALLAYLLTRAGLAPGWGTVRLALVVVYLAVLALPLLLYHALFGGWLLGLPRPGVAAWLSQEYPDAYGLLVTAHTPIDLALIPLAIAVVVLLWGLGDRLLRLAWGQMLLWLAIFLSALAVALSLTIHSTLSHLRFS